MSANRSVQAAQRRRAGPTQDSGRGSGPQPSINSAQIFQATRPGNGPNMPTGRLAGQHAASMQQQMQQQMSQNVDSKPSGITKITVAQAISLITLRLGVIENKLANNPGLEGSGGELDSGFIQTIMARLDELENRPSTSNGVVNNNTELTLMKQQLETIKQAIVQTKTTMNNLVKENAALKTQFHNFSKELNETKELVVALQNLTMDNSQKLLELTVGNNDFDNTDFNDLDTSSNMELTSEEIIGTDLKSLIENELNLEDM